VTGKDFVGAIAGVAIMDTKIIGCHSKGILLGNNNIGGIVGRVKDSFVQYCGSFAEVSGYNQIGGLIGDNQSSAMDNCFARGKIEGIDRVGGLIGNNYMSSVKHSYATGKVTGSINVGGLAGRISEGIEEDINNYWDTESSELKYSALGQGRTTKEMTYPYAENTYLQWNFRDIWANDEVGELNDGYPYLKTDIVVSVYKEELVSVNKVRISNYPNPFNPTTTISFELENESEVELSIFNVKGQKIATLYKGLTKPGVNKVVWDGIDQMGGQVPSGIYLYKLSTSFGTFNKKMMVLK
jgi:hypothetical protein